LSLFSTSICIPIGIPIGTMASTGDRPLGVTAPLSTALPTPAENVASDALIEELKRQNNYESVADTQKRYEAEPYRFPQHQLIGPAEPKR
jgi:hypothetical protein